MPANDTACLPPQVICTCPQEFNCTASLRKEQEGGSVWLWIIKTPHNGFHRKSVGMQYKEFKEQNPIWICSKPYDFRDGGILDDSWLESQLVIDQCGVVFLSPLAMNPLLACLFVFLKVWKRFADSDSATWDTQGHNSKLWSLGHTLGAKLFNWERKEIWSRSSIQVPRRHRTILGISSGTQTLLSL